MKKLYYYISGKDSIKNSKYSGIGYEIREVVLEWQAKKRETKVSLSLALIMRRLRKG